MDKLKLIPVAEWVQGGMTAYDETIHYGHSTGWLNMDPHFRVAPSQLTTVTGIPGHGKTEVVECISVHMAKAHGWRTAFLSPEKFPNRRHVKSIIEKWEGKRAADMGRAAYLRALEQIEERFEFMELGEDGATLQDVLAMISGLKVQMAVIDPWNHLEMKLKGGMETDFIREALKAAVRFVRKTSIHLFIVAHPQKVRRDKEGNIQKPNAYDIHGSAHWFNLSDNVLMAFRGPLVTELWSLKVKWQPDNGVPGMGELKFDPKGHFRDATPADHITPEAMALANQERERIKAKRAALGIFRPSELPEGDMRQLEEG